MACVLAGTVAPVLPGEGCGRTFADAVLLGLADAVPPGLAEAVLPGLADAPLPDLTGPVDFDDVDPGVSCGADRVLVDFGPVPGDEAAVPFGA